MKCANGVESLEARWLRSMFGHRAEPLLFEKGCALRCTECGPGFQAKNQPSCNNIDERDEAEAGHQRVRSIVQKANRVGSSEPSELSD